MMKVTLRMAVIAGLAAACAAGPAAAQPGVAAPSPAITLTPAERIALLPVKQAADAGNWAGASALIPAARSAVRTSDGRYVLGRLELDVAVATQNRTAQRQAIDAVIGVAQGIA
jgi:hypothetical protein